MVEDQFEVVTALNDKLSNIYLSLAKKGENLFKEHNYEAALENFNTLYTTLLENQPPQKRYHKGYPLHWIGLTLLMSEKQAEALACPPKTSPGKMLESGLS